LNPSVRPGSSADFFSAVLLLMFTGFLFHQSLLIHEDAKVSWAVSPALLPMFLASCLFICCMILLLRSQRGQNLAVLTTSVGANVKSWFCSNTSDWKRIVGGVVLLGVYIFALIPLFEFWLSSSLFLITLFFFLRAASVGKIALVTVAAVGGIIVLFNKIFNVTLP